MKTRRFALGILALTIVAGGHTVAPPIILAQQPPQDPPDAVPTTRESAPGEPESTAAETVSAPAANAPEPLSEEVVWSTYTTKEHTWLVESPASELKVRMVPLTRDELAERASLAVSALHSLADGFAEAVVEQMRITSEDSTDKERLAEVNQRLEAIRNVRNKLVTRTNIVLAALEKKGGDVAEARAYVTAVERLVPDAPVSGDEPVLTDEARAAQALADRVATAVAKVREMPPVHERPEPWTISVNELQLELQPLRKDQIDGRVQKWLDILQGELRQRIRMDIALTHTEDDAERQALADQSAGQQEIVQAIVERCRAAMVILQKRGGETREYQDYISNATGQRLNLTDPAVLLAQVRSWFRSPTGGVKVGLSLLRFLVILGAFWVGSRIIGALISSAMRRIAKNSTLLHKFLADIARWTVMIVGFVVALSALGVTIGPLMAAIGAAGLVIGLALQGTLSNFASGILILVSRPFDVGDVVSAGGVFGKVDAMNLVSTRILTADNQVMLVPNNQIWNGVITNVTALDTRRVDLVFGISYGDDMAKAQSLIEQVVKAHPKVLADPAPVIKVHELADSSVNFIVRPWSKTGDYWDVFWDLTRQIKERFDAEGISIPFPQRDVHLYAERTAEAVGK